jgi:hypothetical protein
MNEINYILSKFPKKKPPLAQFYRDNYNSFYDNNRNAKSLVTKISSYLEQWMHLVISSNNKINNPKILEIGAGTLNHIPYEKKYQTYDIIEPYVDMYKNTSLLSRVNNIFTSIYDVPPNFKYDLIISIATLEHVEDLPAILVKAADLLDNNSDASLKIAIPSEGSFLWYLAWRFGTGLGFWLKYGKSYKPFMNYEHINSSHEIESLIHFFFKDITVKRFPFEAFHLSLYTYIEASNLNLNNIKYYLDSTMCAEK